MNIDNYKILLNVLNDDECSKLILFIDDLFIKHPDPDSLEIDGYNRIKISYPELSDMVTAKLSIHMDTTNIHINHQWFPTKYIIGGGLKEHSDGHIYDDDDNASSHTILIYLNENFSGGKTVFTDNNIQVIPKTGMILILDQDALHCAESITDGW